MVKNSAIGVTIVSVLIFAAAFMPWGEIRATPAINLPFGGNFPLGGNPLSGMNMTITITGWNGSITLGGLSLPNWLVVLASAGVAALCWLKAASVWDAPSAVLFALAGYGLLHTGVAWLALMGSDKSSAGVGSFLTALAFIGILVILVQQARSPKTASPPDQTLQPPGPA
ncbi:MAG: hypothetical protein ABSF26_20540 [Thermoguttaceae bacterium]|jgi:hypothetical protein